MKKLLLTVLSVIILISVFCTNVYGMVSQGRYPENDGLEGYYYKPQLPMTGNCGDYVTFNYDTDQSFVVKGKGDMYNYEYLGGIDIEIERILFPGVYPPWLSVGFDCSEEDLAVMSDGEIRKITVDTGVTYIGNNSFRNCEYLTDVSLPETLKEIGAGAFKGCCFTSVDLSDNVVILGVSNDRCYLSKCSNGAFEKCRSLTNINISESSKLKTIGKNTFEECIKLKTFNKGNTLPSVETISQNAFYHCASLKNISLPKVNSIDNMAFKNCTALSKINLLNNIITIGKQAFYKCSKISNINLGKHIQIIEQGAFRDCKSLKTVTITSKILHTVGKNAFYNVNKNVKFRVPKSKLKQYKKLIAPNAPKTAKFVAIK